MASDLVRNSQLATFFVRGKKVRELILPEVRIFRFSRLLGRLSEASLREYMRSRRPIRRSVYECRTLEEYDTAMPPGWSAVLFGCTSRHEAVQATDRRFSGSSSWPMEPPIERKKVTSFF